eukprot:SAG22_NODE_8030_length_689_cov_1.269492_1_plen_128_part_01
MHASQLRSDHPIYFCLTRMDGQEMGPGGPSAAHERPYYHSTTQEQDELIRTALGACDARVTEVEREVASYRLACSAAADAIPPSSAGLVRVLLPAGRPPPRAALVRAWHTVLQAGLDLNPPRVVSWPP